MHSWSLDRAGKSHIGVEMFCPVFLSKTSTSQICWVLHPFLLQPFPPWNCSFQRSASISLPVSDAGSPWVVSGLRNDDIGDE